MPTRDEKHDTVWKALSDPTRREILDLLRDGPRQTTEVVERFPGLSRFGVMKHLDVLREANLVSTRAEGRTRINSLNAAPLRDAIERWIGKYEAYWANSALRVRDAAEAKAASRKAPKKGRKKA
ncbi:Transcriptional repressor SdpR [Pseudobythopirellula maris]|uniref:Transcriptional repressor SdpR n=1 Tax=Pseudobythopirellula maris TaxID=2527991 RepID=A0A5C5ZPC9_9BACT|nr:metalloregulator ArsR/SmtB family transcription factor [Pseudobythopirellula maris]TWT89026.1 Transcriptional repressor SdpR [Pseudobythopirellula maris]